MPEVVVEIAIAWAILLLLGGGLLLLRGPDVLHRILALDVLVAIVIAMLALLSYLRGVSYTSTRHSLWPCSPSPRRSSPARYVIRGGPF